MASTPSPSPVSDPTEPPTNPDFSIQEHDLAEGRVGYHWVGRAPNPGFPLKRDELPGITSMGMWATAYPQPVQADASKTFPIKELQISMYESGGIVLERSDGFHEELKPHTLIMALPREAYTSKGLRGTGYWINLDVGAAGAERPWKWPAWVVLAAKDREELEWRLRHRAHPTMEAPREMRETFHRLGRAIRAHEQGEPHGVSQMAVHLNLLLLHLLQALKSGQAERFGSLDARHAESVRRCWERLEAQPALLAGPLDPDELAKDCGVSPHTFRSVTRDILGETPARHLLSLRLARAARLLREQPERSMLDIALDCGFSTSQYFATCFGKRFKCTPRDWRAGRGGAAPLI